MSNLRPTLSSAHLHNSRRFLGDDRWWWSIDENILIKQQVSSRHNSNGVDVELLRRNFVVKWTMWWPFLEFFAVCKVLCESIERTFSNGCDVETFTSTNCKILRAFVINAISLKWSGQAVATKSLRIQKLTRRNENVLVFFSNGRRGYRRVACNVWTHCRINSTWV